MGVRVTYFVFLWREGDLVPRVRRWCVAILVVDLFPKCELITLLMKGRGLSIVDP